MRIANYDSTREMLINAVKPMQTNHYKPVLHEQLMDLTLNSIEKAGFVLDKETYSSAKSGQVANGRYTIKNVRDNEMQLEIGWQNSYDKSLSLKFAIGARIFICQNGCVHGDMGAFRKKHMGDVQEFTPATITEYIKTAGESFQVLCNDKARMKEIELTKRVKAELVGRLYLEEAMLTSDQLNIIAGQMVAPTIDYNCPDSLWELYNFTTYAVRGRLHPSHYMDTHSKIHRFFVNESGMLTPSEQVLITMPTMPVEEESPFVQLEMFEGEAD